jgi:hypothetical protein
MKRDKPPPAIVTKTPRGLSPVAAYDQELIMGDAIGSQYDLVKRSRRSLPQQRLYWATLGNVVRATGKWPTAEHLHDDLKLVCGYRRQVVDWVTGEVGVAVDSTAFDAMTGDEFKVYFDIAMAKLAEHIGYDPLAFGIAA